MNDKVFSDLTQSADAFLRIVWPTLLSYNAVQDGEIISLEQSVKSELAKILDVYAGFDALQLSHKDGLRGIASRIQTLDRTEDWLKSKFPYNTFTIRASRESGATTELTKRRDAITSGAWLYPHLTVQAYLTSFDGDWLSMAVIKTADLIDIIDNPPTPDCVTENKVTKNGSATFKVVRWDKVPRGKIKILINENLQTQEAA